jgi:hypothetical protein
MSQAGEFVDPKQKEELEREEARRKAQVDFDPKLHGVGTQPVVEPESVKHLWQSFVKPLLARVEALERRMPKPVPPKPQLPAGEKTQ